MALWEVRSPMPVRLKGGDGRNLITSVSSSLSLAFGTVVDEHHQPLGRFVIAPYDRRYRLWETFLAVLVVLSFPFLLTFKKVKTVDLTVDAFFAVDIVLTFFVAYLDKTTYLLESDHRKIAVRYASKLRLPMDIASTLPFALLYKLFTGKTNQHDLVGFLNLLHLWRLRRVSQLFSRLRKDPRFNYVVIRATTKLISVTLFAAVSRIYTYCVIHVHNFMYKFQVIKKDHVASGLCCIELFMNSSSQDEAIQHLEQAKTHFDEGSLDHQKGDSTKETLTKEEIWKLNSRISIQLEVVQFYKNFDGPPWNYSLFGNPNDAETLRRRCTIAETLVEKNFDLAFQVIYEFDLPAIGTYNNVAVSLAERKMGDQLADLFRNIKGSIDDEDLDEVLGAAINVYANKHKERPDRLIDMLTSSHGGSDDAGA